LRPCPQDAHTTHGRPADVNQRPPHDRRSGTTCALRPEGRRQPRNQIHQRL
jgi:hypothetical protein